MHGLGHRIEIQRARRLDRLGPDLNRGVGVERVSQRLVALRAESRHDVRPPAGRAHVRRMATMSVPSSPGPAIIGKSSVAHRAVGDQLEVVAAVVRLAEDQARLPVVAADEEDSTPAACIFETSAEYSASPGM